VIEDRDARWEGLGFPKTPAKTIKGEGTRERKAVRKRDWKRKHDAKYRQLERERQRRREKNRKHYCRWCGNVLIRVNHTYCQSCVRIVNRSLAWFAQAKLELSTPFDNGQNADFEARLQQLDALHKEQPL
jgi:hypothetical protein